MFANKFNDVELEKPLIWVKEDTNKSEILKKTIRQQKINKKKLKEISRRKQAQISSVAKPSESKEDDEFFVFQQNKIAAEMRIKEKREKTIDILFNYIKTGSQPSNDGNFLPPYKYLNGLRLPEMEELKEKISLFVKFDHQHLQFWKDIETIVNGEITKLKSTCVQQPVNYEIIGELDKIIKGKSPEKLAKLKDSIKRKMATEIVDIDYWENLLARVDQCLARARCDDLHSRMFKRKIEITVDENSRELIDPLEGFKKKYKEGEYSPKFIDENELDSSIVVLNPEEDSMKIVESQNSIKNINSSSTSIDKYRPRKPRYFNRVHTGFEWNKYNQTHYDIDNPPPKIVQGYKFNIFYPDLVDPSQVPTYTITSCEDKDFAEIRFKAGPPYEEISFKIVNREWNYSNKSGFRCQFINNILQLWFQFKRYRYRK